MASNKKVPSQIQFPEITKLLQTEEFEKVNKDFSRAFEELEKISKNNGLKKAATARKGMKGIEKTLDLLRELLRNKYAMQEKEKGKQPVKGK